MRTLRDVRPASPPDEGGAAGFTLVELVIAISILGVVMAALTAAMLVAMTGNSQSGERLGESADVAFAASYFADDAAGAQTVTAGGATRCGTAGKAVVEFQGTTFATGNLPQVTVVSYLLETVGSGTTASRQLHRSACIGPSLAALGVQSQNTVARQLSTATDPTLTCQSPTGAGVACSAATSVQLQLHESSGFTFTLVGTRRTS